MKNEYIPHPAIVKSIQPESSDTKTFMIVFEDKTLAKSFNYKPGQFVQVSLLGVGEAPISIASCPEVKEKDLYFIAGGIGLPPLRSVIKSVFDRRGDFGKIKILYGAKTPCELCFREELKAWSRIIDTEVLLAVNEPDQTWEQNVGVVTTLWDKTDMTTLSGVAYVCGPPVMIRFVIEKLLKSGFKDENIYITLERYMKCGIGKCGHCNVGEKFVCIDGPVFSYAQLKRFPDKEKAIA